MFNNDVQAGRLRGWSSVSRRDFIKRASLATVGATLLVAGSRTWTQGLPDIPGEALLRSTFARHVGTAFAVVPEAGGRTLLRLADVRDLPGSAATSAQREHSFSLLFRGAAAQPLNQGTYRFEQNRIGRFSIFITPQAPSQSARLYEAIFNRL